MASSSRPAAGPGVRARRADAPVEQSAQRMVITGPGPGGTDSAAVALADDARPFLVPAGERPGCGELGGVRSHDELQQAARCDRGVDAGAGIALAEFLLQLGREVSPCVHAAPGTSGHQVRTGAPVAVVLE